MHFQFRIRFRLAGALNVPEDTLVFECGAKPYRLRSGANKPISESTTLVLSAGSFESEDAARLEGDAAAITLLLYALFSGTGIDLGTYRRPGGLSISSAVKEEILRQHGIGLIEERWGVTIAEDSEKVRFVDASGTGYVLSGIDAFQSAFRDSAGVRQPNEKELVSLELLSASRFDSSARPRFLTLVTAIEALLDLRPLAAEAQEAISEFESRLRSPGLAKAELQSLLGSVCHLRNESISKAGSRTAEELLGSCTYSGKEASAFFSFAYKVRSKLVHEGTVKPGLDLEEIANTTGEFVTDLLKASLARPA
jgi:hypothetical protein